MSSEDSSADHRPTGCNLMHPFTLRPDVEWSKESDEFSQTKWEYVRSPVKHFEFRRFQYSSLVGLIMPINMLTVDLVYPLLFYPLTDTLTSPWTLVVLIMGVVWCVLIPLHIFAHVARSSDKRWTRLQMGADIFLFLNLIAVCGYPQFVHQYYHCGDFKDSLIGVAGRTEAEYGWTEERNAIYCQQAIRTFASGFTLVAVPVTTNLPPIGVAVYLLIRVVYAAMARPIAFSQGQWDPPETPAQLVSKAAVFIYCACGGMATYWLRTRAGKLQFEQTVALTREIQEAKAKEDHVDMLLCATVPASALVRLANNKPCSDFTQSATVLFSDMVGFTQWSSTRSPSEVVRMLNIITEAIDQRAVAFQVEKIKTIGDAYWAVTGLPDLNADHAGVMCEFGIELVSLVKSKSEKHPEWGAVQFRIGIHSGALNGGILGNKMISYEVFGETSDVAQLFEQQGAPNRVVVSEETVHEAEIPEDQLTEYLVVEHKGRSYPSFLLKEQHSAARWAWGENNSNKSSRDSQRDVKSIISGRAVEVLDAGKGRRKAFLHQKATAQARKQQQQVSSESTSGSNDSEEAIRGRFSMRRWRFLLSTYADPNREAEFILFALEKQKPMRFWTRVLILLIPVLLFTATGIEGAETGVPRLSGSSAAFLVLSIICGSVDLGLLYATAYLQKGAQWPILQAVLNHLTSILLWMGCLFATPRASVTTNDPQWLDPTLFFLNLFGNCGGVVGTLWLVLGNTFVVWPFIWAANWRVLQYGAGRSMDTQLLIILGFLLAVFERQGRQQFLEFHLQQFFHTEQLRRVAEQDALLKSIVPEHISGALLTWMSGDMKTPLLRNYSSCAVAFLHLQPPRGRSATAVLGEHHSSPLCVLSSDHDAVGVDVIDDDSVLIQNGEHQGSTPHGSPTLLVEATPAFEASPFPEHWESAAITHVDDLLSKYEGISKIKTMGDVVMLAGPFSRDEGDFQSVRDVTTSPEELQQAVHELVQVSQALAGVGGGVHSGIHCGPLVGAIQGTSRLCFDVFGDTVNVASRTMTGCAKLDRRNVSFCAMSQDAFSTLKGDLVGKEQLQLDTFNAVEVTAKGKGTFTAFLSS